MAVPKRKTTPSRAGKRRSHKAIEPINIVVSKTSGNPVLPHHVDKKDGRYGDHLVFIKKTSNQSEEAAEQN